MIKGKEPNKNKICYCPECEYDLEQYKQSEKLIGDPKLKKSFEKRARRIFRTDNALTQHMDKMHRDLNDVECPTHCLECGKKLSWKETQYCGKCQKEIDAEMQKGLEEDMKANNVDEQEDVHQAGNDAYNARFKDSRGRSIFSR